MSAVAAASEKKRLESSCAAVLQGMSGKTVVVEMRDENYVIGTLESCDSQLNMRLQNVTLIRNFQKSQEAEYFVTGKHVRFVHFENRVHSEAAIRRCQKGVSAVKSKFQPNRRLDQKQFDGSRKIVD
uniref:Sm domain-containing protein n=1 Tax=Caenorhabditis japonica TaxID=281687 RepID=A0A8R1DRF4_CAEJA